MIPCCAFCAANPCASRASPGANQRANCGRTTKRWCAQKLSFDLTGKQSVRRAENRLLAAKNRSVRSENRVTLLETLPTRRHHYPPSELLRRSPASSAVLKFLCVKVGRCAATKPLGMRAAATSSCKATFFRKGSSSSHFGY
jgi:hypothetical protein